MLDRLVVEVRTGLALLGDRLDDRRGGERGQDTVAGLILMAALAVAATAVGVILTAWLTSKANQVSSH